MNENQNNKTESNIDELITQGEEMSSGDKPKQAGFNKPIIIAGIILAIVVIVVFVFINSQSTQNQQETVTELSKDRVSTEPINKEEIRKELAKPRSSTLTEKEKQSIRESLAQ